MSSKLLSFFSRWVTPNQLTLFRIFVVPILYGLIHVYRENHWILLATWLLYVLACLTDYWDGVLARFQNNTSRLGQLLDPVADKILLASLMIALVEVDRAPGTLVTLILMRELAITGLRSVAASEGRVISANSGGKLKTFSQMFAVGFLMIHYQTLWLPCHEIGIGLLWFSTGVTLWTGWQYFHKFYFEKN